MKETLIRTWDPVYALTKASAPALAPSLRSLQDAPARLDKTSFIPIVSSSAPDEREYSPNAPYDLSYVGILFAGGTLLN